VRARRRGQRGFTIIELMIALVVSSLLVGMILAIFMRMSLAYRGQQQLAGVQQVLASARATFEIDAKMAGLEMSQGFKTTVDSKRHSPVEITNSSTGPDQIAFFYADPSSQAVVTNSATPVTVNVDSSVGFVANDLVVMSTPDVTTLANPINPGADAKLVTFDACVLKIQAVSATTMTFSTAAPWGFAGNPHCIGNTTPNKTMIFKFVAHAYRIDPTVARLPDGVLQMSPTGNLQTAVNDWQDLAFGFTDLQVATQFFEAGDAVDTPDPDTDPTREWYSAAMQATLTAPGAYNSSFTTPIELAISLVARTDRDVEGIATAQTPALTVSTNTANNTLGDHDFVTLPSATDDRLKGFRIYRYVTFQVDLRNMGMGR
jgi:prepilin-type N-terminal cleavage/methylation domain-containing protein